MNRTEEKRKEQLLAKMLKSDFKEEKDLKITFYYKDKFKNSLPAGNLENSRSR